MGRIQLFPLSFQNGCSQSSRFPTAGLSRETRLWERDCHATETGLNSGLMSHLARMQTFLFFFAICIMIMSCSIAFFLTLVESKNKRRKNSEVTSFLTIQPAYEGYANLRAVSFDRPRQIGKRKETVFFFSICLGSSKVMLTGK